MQYPPESFSLLGCYPAALEAKLLELVPVVHVSNSSGKVHQGSDGLIFPADVLYACKNCGCISARLLALQVAHRTFN